MPTKETERGFKIEPFGEFYGIVRENSKIDFNQSINWESVVHPIRLIIGRNFGAM